MSDNEYPHIDDGRVKVTSPILNFDPMPAPIAGIFDAPSVYVCVNTEWWSFLLQRLYILRRPEAWLGDQTEKVRASQEIEKFLAMANCEDCSEFITDLRIAADGTLQKKVGGVWQNASGDGGDTTVINNNSTLVSEQYPPEPTNAGLTAEERACGIATGLSEWIYGKLNDILDTMDAAINDATVLDSALLFIFPPAYIIVDQFDDVIDEISEALISTIRAGITSEQVEATLCAIYDYLVTTGIVDGSNVAGLKAAINSSAGITIAGTMAKLMEALANEALIHRAMLYQNAGTGNCAALCGGDTCVEATFSSFGFAGQAGELSNLTTLPYQMIYNPKHGQFGVTNLEFLGTWVGVDSSQRHYVGVGLRIKLSRPVNIRAINIDVERRRADGTGVNADGVTYVFNGLKDSTSYYDWKGVFGTGAQGNINLSGIGFGTGTPGEPADEFWIAVHSRPNVANEIGKLRVFNVSFTYEEPVGTNHTVNLGSIDCYVP